MLQHPWIVAAKESGAAAVAAAGARSSLPQDYLLRVRGLVLRQKMKKFFFEHQIEVLYLYCLYTLVVVFTDLIFRVVGNQVAPRVSAAVDLCGGQSGPHKQRRAGQRQ